MKLVDTSNSTWVEDAEILVENHPDSTSDRSTWKIAILEVHPRKSAFYIGFRPSAGAPAQFFSKPACMHNQLLAMRVGHNPVYFVARPVDGRTKLLIELVEITTEDDPNFKEIPLY